MIQLLFVNELTDDNTRLQECRSHSARVDHQRRRQRKIIARGHPQVLSTDGYMDYPHDLRPKNVSNMITEVLSPSIIIQPRCPLMLGPESSPAASLDGHEYINFYVTRARSKRSFIIPAFGMSTMHSLDWAEFMANRLLYHAGAAFVHRIHEGTNGPSKTVLKHRGKAIEEVRKHLSVVGENGQSVDPHAIAAVVMLAALDEQMGNTASYELHRKMIGILMACRGDISLDYNPIYFFISEAEVDWASRTGYSVLKYNQTARRKTPITAEFALQDQWKFAAIPIGFRSLIAAGEVSVEVAEAVTNMSEALLENKEELHRQDPSRQDYFQVFPYLHPDYPEDLMFDDLLELALLLFGSHTVVPYDPGLGMMYATRKRLTERLPAYLSQRGTSLSQTEMRTLLWIGMLTLYAWENGPTNIQCDQANWLLLDLPLELLATLDEDKVEELLREYFWTKDFLAFGRKRWKSISTTQEVKESNSP